MKNRSIYKPDWFGIGLTIAVLLGVAIVLTAWLYGQLVAAGQVLNEEPAAITTSRVEPVVEVAPVPDVTEPEAPATAPTVGATTQPEQPAAPEARDYRADMTAAGIAAADHSYVEALLATTGPRPYWANCADHIERMANPTNCFQVMNFGVVSDYETWAAFNSHMESL